MARLDLSDHDRDALGHAALGWVLKYFAEAASGPVYPSVSADDLRAMVAEPLPREAQDPAVVFEQFVRLAMLGRNNGHPRMFGYVQSSGNFAGVIGDFLASALNQNVTSWRSAPAATTIELQVIDWLKALVGFDPLAGGMLVSGGSAANLAALAVALRVSTDLDLNGRGVSALPAPPAVYASARAHLSIPKAASLLGIGRDAMQWIPVDGAGRMDVRRLADAIARGASDGHHQICVVANAGDVNTGAVDPIDDIADVCESRGLWLHVDGSYGGFAAAAPRVASLFQGLDRADSISLDPHKWLFSPLDVGCLLVRHASGLHRAFAQAADYIDVVADRDMSDFAFWDVSPELSRRFRALKIWFALKCHGASAVLETIDANIAMAEHLAAAIDGRDDFERLAPAPLSIVCFRYVPAALRGREAALNDLNRELMVAVQRDGNAYLSNAMLGSSFALRACIVNHRTTVSDIEMLLDTIERLGTALCASRS
ncbi:MAG: pyridoxal-dependent decarboxylase [Acidobacteria bacterium]|nr:pyridoxal-dependent decarboxylase [Acidobacteriota bacterium]